MSIKPPGSAVLARVDDLEPLLCGRALRKQHEDGGQKAGGDGEAPGTSATACNNSLNKFFH